MTASGGHEYFKQKSNFLTIFHENNFNFFFFNNWTDGKAKEI